MKHAVATTIAKLEPLLSEVRKLDGLREKKPGIYYYKSKALLHFHEDGDEIFGDVRLKHADFDRFPAPTRKHQQALLKAIKQHLAGQG